MKQSLAVRSLFCAAALFCSLSASWAVEVVVDGGFEAAPAPAPMETQGPFSPAWTVVDPSGPQPPGSLGSHSNVGHDALFAHSGSNHANLGATGLLGSLSQNLTTMPGQMYTLSFWLANDGAADVGAGELNEFDVFWNGASVFAQSNVGVFNYTHFTLQLTATAASTPLEFLYRNDIDFFRLDDVSVTDVPEPSVTWLALAGVGTLCVARYRGAKRRRLLASI